MVPFKSVRVGPFDVTIGRLEADDKDAFLGTFSTSHMIIRTLDSYPTPQLEAETLLHEIFHAIYCVMNIKKKDSEERVVSLAATGMAMVIKDNPDLMRWLTESLQ